MTIGGAATTYLGDALGRRISRAAPSGTTAYTWDAVGHLSSVVDPGSGLSAAYTYGASGMREAKSVTQGGVTTTTRSLWAGGVLLAEKDSDGTLLTFAYGPGGLPLAVQVARSSETTTYAYHTDAFGSVVALSDGSGVVVARYSYDPWGSPTSVTGSNAWLAARQPLRYRGYYWDSETALFYLPARYYDPALGRFLSCDPASPSAGNPLSLNQYAYCEGDPVNASDPSGAITDIEAEAWSCAYRETGGNRAKALAKIKPLRETRREIARQNARAARAAYSAKMPGTVAKDSRLSGQECFAYGLGGATIYVTSWALQGVGGDMARKGLGMMAAGLGWATSPDPAGEGAAAAGLATFAAGASVWLSCETGKGTGGDMVKMSFTGVKEPTMAERVADHMNSGDYLGAGAEYLPWYGKMGLEAATQ